MTVILTVSSYPLGDAPVDATFNLHEGAEIVDAAVVDGSVVLIVQEDLAAPSVSRTFALRNVGDVIVNGTPIAFATGNDGHTALAVFEVES